MFTALVVYVLVVMLWFILVEEHDVTCALMWPIRSVLFLLAMVAIVIVFIFKVRQAYQQLD